MWLKKSAALSRTQKHRNYRSDILCSPWYYGTADRHNANHATRMAIVKNGKYTLLEGCRPVQDPALAPILA